MSHNVARVCGNFFEICVGPTNHPTYLSLDASLPKHKNTCFDWAMRETLFDFVGFSKTGSDTTIEPNFDEMTASGI